QDSLGFGLGCRHQANRSDTALDIDAQSHRRFSISLVHVVVSIFLQPWSMDRADSAGRVYLHSNILRKANRRRAHSALDGRVEIVLPRAGEVSINRPYSTMDFEPFQRQADKIQVLLAGSGLQRQIQRDIVVQAQLPIVLLGAVKVSFMLVLRDGKKTVGSGGVVGDRGLAFALLIIEIGLQEFLGSARDLK